MDKSIKVEKKSASPLASNTEKIPCESLAFAADNLIKQLDLMRRDESYQNVFNYMSVHHNFLYQGPTFGIQLEVLRQELQRYKRLSERA